MRKKVQFDVEDDLGEDPHLPVNLTSFLQRATADQWKTLQAKLLFWPWTLHEYLGMMTTSIIPSTWAEFTLRPLTKLQVLVNPDLQRDARPNNPPRHWIKAEIERAGTCPRWSKDMKAIWTYSFEDPHKVYSIETELIIPEVEYLFQWQTVVFWLLLAQKEVSGWWESPPSVLRLHHWDFISYVDATEMQDFKLQGRRRP